MNLVLTVLEIVAPVFLLASVGFTWVKAGRDYPTGFVSQLAMTLAMPCLVFSTLVRTDLSPATLSTVALATLAGYAAAILAMAAMTRGAGLSLRTYLTPLTFGNTGNLGLPLALFAYGEAGLGYAIAIFAAMLVLMFTIGLWAVAGKAAGVRALVDPMVMASLLGALFLWQGWRLPGWLEDSVALIGQMAIPLMLLTLGVAVSRLRPGKLTRAVVLSMARSVLLAAIALAAWAAFDLPRVAGAVLVLQMITPVSVTSYLLAEKYDAEAEAVASLVVVSTLLAVGTLPLALALLGPG